MTLSEKLKRIPHNNWAMLTYICMVCAIVSLCIDAMMMASIYFTLSFFCAVEYDYFNLKKRIKELEEKVNGES